MDEVIGTFRITEVRNEEGTDVTGFASEEERITLYKSCRDESLRCLVTTKFSRDELNWERLRFQRCKRTGGATARLAGHDITITAEGKDGIQIKITGNPVGTVMGKVD